MNSLIGYYSPNRFEKLPDGWIRDNMPGNEREWGPSSPVILGPEERKKFCEDLGGSEPEAHESASIVNYKGENGFFPIFADTKTDDWYATKTEVAWGRNAVRVVNYDFGSVGYRDRGNRYYVRPVRPISNQRGMQSIEKLTLTDRRYLSGSVTEMDMWDKINELVDALNDLREREGR